MDDREEKRTFVWTTSPTGPHASIVYDSYLAQIGDYATKVLFKRPLDEHDLGLSLTQLMEKYPCPQSEDS